MGTCGTMFWDVRIIIVLFLKCSDCFKLFTAPSVSAAQRNELSVSAPLLLYLCKFSFVHDCYIPLQEPYVSSIGKKTFAESSWPPIAMNRLSHCLSSSTRTWDVVWTIVFIAEFPVGSTHLKRELVSRYKYIFPTDFSLPPFLLSMR